MARLYVVARSECNTTFCRLGSSENRRARGRSSSFKSRKTFRCPNNCACGTSPANMIARQNNYATVVELSTQLGNTSPRIDHNNLIKDTSGNFEDPRSRQPNLFSPVSHLLRNINIACRRLTDFVSPSVLISSFPTVIKILSMAVIKLHNAFSLYATRQCRRYDPLPSFTPSRRRLKNVDIHVKPSFT